MCVESNYQHFDICLTSSFALMAGAEHPVKNKGRLAEEQVRGKKRKIFNLKVNTTGL